MKTVSEGAWSRHHWGENYLGFISVEALGSEVEPELLEAPCQIWKSLPTQRGSYGRKQNIPMSEDIITWSLGKLKP